MLAARTSVGSSAGLRSQCRTRHIAPRAPCRRPVRVMALFGGGKEGGGNPLANMGKLMESMAQAQRIVQEKTQAIQKELESTEFDGYDEEETVRVVMSGNQVPKAVEITDEAMAVGGEELSRRLTLAMKEAHGKSVMGMKEKMKDLASALGLPASAAGLGGGNNGGLPGM